LAAGAVVVSLAGCARPAVVEKETQVSYCQNVRQAVTVLTPWSSTRGVPSLRQTFGTVEQLRVLQENIYENALLEGNLAVGGASALSSKMETISDSVGRARSAIIASERPTVEDLVAATNTPPCAEAPPK
jgi:hypothetical protein